MPGPEWRDLGGGKPTSPRTLRVVLVAEESAGLRTLRLVQASGHEVAAVLAAGPALRKAAGEAGCPLLPAHRVQAPDLASDLRTAGADLLLNVHSLHVVHPEVLRAPRIGCFNLHPGPLPRYAGLDTVSWALFRGETEYGVTLHQMAERIDAGGVAFRASFPVEPDDTALSLYSRCIRRGLGLVERLLETAAAEGRVPVDAQDLSRREYFHRGPPDGGRLAWDRTARAVRNFVRACDYGPFPSPWGRPRTTLAGREVAILEAALTGDPAHAPPGTVRAPKAAPSARQVACSDEWLEIQALTVDGKGERPAAALPPGTRLG